MLRVLTALFWTVVFLAGGVAIDTAGAGRGSQKISEAALREIYTEFVCRRLQKDAADVVVSKFNVYGEQDVPAGVMDFRVFQKNVRPLEGFVRLNVLVHIDGIVCSELRLSGWVDVFGTVVCAVRELKRGDLIRSRDVRLERRNISRASGRLIQDPAAAVGRLAKTTIQEGCFVKEWMLENAPVVERGDRVLILVESSFLRITAPGKALSEGEAGELIPVMNLQSEKMIHAKVRDAETVTVGF